MPRPNPTQSSSQPRAEFGYAPATRQSRFAERSHSPEALKGPELQNEIRETLHGIASYIHSTATPDRNDRFWPGGADLFATNPMSLAHGAAGIALFLKRSDSLDAATLDWLQVQPLSTARYVPGFWMGLAGIAYSFSELGLGDKAEESLRLCYASPLKYADPSLFNGAAGWGLVSLYFFRKTGRDEYLSRALEAAQWLSDHAVRSEQGWTWTTPTEENTPLGFGHGASGIALFLLMAGRVTNDERLLDAARAGFEFDFAYRLESPWGWTWPAQIGGDVALPYWGSGAAGIGGVALRLHQCLGEPRYLDLANAIADATYLKWTIQPGLFSGLTGIAEFMLDCYVVTERPEYLDRAYDIAKTLLLYRVYKPEGIAYPDRWLRRLSNDVAAGSAGVGLFFHRLLRPGRNPFVDLVTTLEG